ncbi:phenylacetate--CoA ligase family protein [Geofilum rubicundum]|uniref:Coenzyme F390 synthetase n=1 Tax=Geofilum rubicundum JCM 15548 TaxID=1236989 RepID=A0A0E9LTE9_9BACT|nr:phenylacetate--CoA ligase family protein [Geofilum rubicundum]GAO28529.1 coenzyme F390 synthetase [Geofilum rubicundum JCM 15548]
MDFFTLLGWTGFPVKEAAQKFKTFKQASQSPEWMERQKWEAFSFHYQGNTNYRKFIGDYPSTWNEIPVINKNTIREHAIGRVPDLNAYPKYYHRQTSGSTGKPFDYAIDYLSHALTWRLLEDRYHSAGVTFNDLQARFFGTPYSLVSKVTERLKDRLTHRIRFNTVDLSDDNMERWLSAFGKKPFVYIYGYAYPIVTFAKFLTQRGISLKTVAPRLKLCIVTSEMCSPEEQQMVEEVFGVPVYNEYGASEAGIVGFGRNNRWELSRELMLTEVLDDDNQPCANGVVGKVVLTPLFNMGTPLIRYEIGDMAAIDEADGVPYLTRLQGRIEEMAILESGKKVAGDTLFLYVFKEFTKHCSEVSEYKVIQTAPDRFVVNVVATRELTEEEVGRLKKLCVQALETSAKIEVVRKEVLDRTLMGKFKRFERQF